MCAVVAQYIITSPPLVLSFFFSSPIIYLILLQLLSLVSSAFPSFLLFKFASFPFFLFPLPSGLCSLLLTLFSLLQIRVVFFNMFFHISQYQYLAQYNLLSLLLSELWSYHKFSHLNLSFLTVLTGIMCFDKSRLLKGSSSFVVMHVNGESGHYGPYWLFFWRDHHHFFGSGTVTFYSVQALEGWHRFRWEKKCYYPSLWEQYFWHNLQCMLLSFWIEL